MGIVEKAEATQPVEPTSGTRPAIESHSRIFVLAARWLTDSVWEGMRKTAAVLVLFVGVFLTAYGSETSLKLDVYTLPMAGMWEVRSILTNTGSAAVTVPTRSYSDSPDATGTGSGKASFFFIIGFVELSDRRLVPSPSRFFPVTLQPGESTELPVIECRTPDVKEISVLYIVEEDFATRHRWWHGEVAKSVIPGQEKDNPYITSMVIPFEPPPELPEEKNDAQSGSRE